MSNIIENYKSKSGSLFQAEKLMGPYLQEIADGLAN